MRSGKQRASDAVRPSIHKIKGRIHPSTNPTHPLQTKRQKPTSRTERRRDATRPDPAAEGGGDVRGEAAGGPGPAGVVGGGAAAEGGGGRRAAGGGAGAPRGGAGGAGAGAGARRRAAAPPRADLRQAPPPRRGGARPDPRDPRAPPRGRPPAAAAAAGPRGARTRARSLRRHLPLVFLGHGAADDSCRCRFSSPFRIGNCN